MQDGCKLCGIQRALDRFKPTLARKDDHHLCQIAFIRQRHHLVPLARTNLDRDPSIRLHGGNLNLRLIHWVCGQLQIKTPIRFSREFHPQGAKTGRLVGILKQVNASIYLSGPAAQAYLIPELLENEGIRLEYKKYNYPEYPQLFPPFEPYVSVIDLLFMMGEDARCYLESSPQNQ